LRLRELPKGLADPAREVPLVAPPAIALIDEKDDAEVADVTDNTPDGLVNRPGGLLGIPDLAVEGARGRGCLGLVGVEVVLLHQNAWVIQLRVGDPDHEDAAGRII
jgi:hypothetical protein